MNINLGPPYESIIESAIKEGYAGTHTEVIRQALMAYKKKLEEEEEVRLVAKGVEEEMKLIRSGKVKTKSWEEVRKKYLK